MREGSFSLRGVVCRLVSPIGEDRVRFLGVSGYRFFFNVPWSHASYQGQNPMFSNRYYPYVTHNMHDRQEVGLRFHESCFWIPINASWDYAVLDVFVYVVFSGQRCVLFYVIHVVPVLICGKFSLKYGSCLCRLF